MYGPETHLEVLALSLPLTSARLFEGVSLCTGQSEMLITTAVHIRLSALRL